MITLFFPFQFIRDTPPPSSGASDEREPGPSPERCVRVSSWPVSPLQTEPGCPGPVHLLPISPESLQKLTRRPLNFREIQPPLFSPVNNDRVFPAVPPCTDSIPTVPVPIQPEHVSIRYRTCGYGGAESTAPVSRSRS